MMGDFRDTVMSYNLQENVWEQMPSLNHGRLDGASCEHDGYVYVFGGSVNHFNGFERIRVAGYDS